MKLGPVVTHELRPMRPAGVPRPADAGLAFYVTQRFYTADYYWSNADPSKATQLHGATDIGNTRCGDPIIAPADGTVRRLTDNATAYGAPTNALGVELRLSPDVTMEFWHLNGWTVATGQRVVKGQQLGIVGHTGLGNVCHCHIEGKRRGVKFDIEPYLFGAELALSAEEEAPDDMMLEGEFKNHVFNKQVAVSGNDAAFRASPFIKDNVLKRFDAGTTFYPVVEVAGQKVGDHNTWFGGLLWVGGGWAFGYFHMSVLGPQEPKETVPAPAPAPDPAALAEASRIAADTVLEAAKAAAKPFGAS